MDLHFCLFMASQAVGSPITQYNHILNRGGIFAPDLRGHGKSGKTPGKYGLGDYYKDLQQFIDNIIKEPVVLMGHSIGAIQTCMLASRNKDKIKAAILLDPPLFMRRAALDLLPWWEAYYNIASKEGTIQERIDYMEKLEIGTGGSSMKFTERFDQPMVIAWAMNTVDPSALEVHIRSILEEDYSPLYYVWYDPERILRGIDCPTLLLQAGVGDVLMDSEVNEAKQWLNDVIHVKLSRLDHSLGLWQWNPSEIMRSISFFLESIR